VPTCREVRTLVHKLSDRKPIVMHCSAGIGDLNCLSSKEALGRTGSFVAIEMVCHKLLNQHEGDFDMVELMQNLRDQRTQAVQNDQVTVC
jgi:protein tyrosine phosphatase